MYDKSTKMVALSTLLAFSTAVNGAAHLRPYGAAQPANIEARDPQFGGLQSGLESFFSELGGLFHFGTPATTTSAVSVKASSTSKATSSSTSSSSSKAAAASSSGKASSVVVGTGVATASGSAPVSASPSASAASVASSGVKTSSKASGSAVSVATKAVSSAASSSASAKPASSSIAAASSAQSVSGSAASSGKPASGSAASGSAASGSAASGTGATRIASGSAASGSAASSVKPASGTAASGSKSVSACPAKKSRSKASGTAASGTVASGSKIASGSAASGTGATKIASGSAASGSGVSRSLPASSGAPSSSASVSILTAPSNAHSLSRTRASHSIGHCSSSSCASGASGSSATRSRSSVSGSGAKSSKVATGSVVSSKASSTAAVTTPTLSASSSVTSSASASLTGSVTGPTVTISAGTVVGSALTGGIDQFLGIPYAQPPVGNLRLKPPVALTTGFGVFDATTPPASCPQFASNLTGNYSAGGLQPFINEFVFTPTEQKEDCLTMSVWKPNTTTPDSKLPVVFWIYGGGFEFGATAMFNGSYIVARSVALGEPIIFVEVNYRLGGFGFLAGADLAGEVSTNLGLRDQRLGLEWAADNVAAFGGDPSKVTLWGESAGAISSCYQLTVNGGNNTYKGASLFRGSIHNSGSFAPADNTTAPQAQAIYDQVVDKAGCTASTAAERLACLRSVDFDVLHNATNSVPVFGGYRSADLSYLPRPDAGDTFYDWSAEYAVAAGRWTKTPFIIGDQQDEGTILAIVQNNITTNEDLVNYLATWFPGNANALSDVTGLAALYPDNVTAGQPDGSPYNTGDANNVYPQYKRLSAILGDIVFIITRRAFLNLGTGQGVKAWSYLATYLQGLATFGTLHGSDLAYLFDSLFVNTNPTTSIETYYISFINHLDPNTINTTATAQTWPLWNSSNPQIIDFTGGDPGLMNDTFRSDVYDYLLNHVIGLRV